MGYLSRLLDLGFQGVLSGSPDTSHERSLPGAHQAPECAFAAQSVNPEIICESGRVAEN